jgi:pyridoxine 5-phosphate synthase
MTKLSVNVNKIATLRNARGGNLPDVLKMALDIVAFGADGITVHPRPDGRHIRSEDVHALSSALEVELNVEGYPDERFLSLVEQIRPAQCTLVPDPPHVLTSNAGWKIKENQKLLQDTVQRLQDAGVRTSLFVDPHTLSAQDIELLTTTNTDRVELYTESYAKAYPTDARDEVLDVFIKQAQSISKLGIALNAGHDLNLDNLKYFIKAIPQIEEVSIGHALVADALYLGMQETIRRYKSCLC